MKNHCFKYVELDSLELLQKEVFNQIQNQLCTEQFISYLFHFDKAL